MKHLIILSFISVALVACSSNTTTNPTTADTGSVQINAAENGSQNQLLSNDVTTTEITNTEPVVTTRQINSSNALTILGHVTTIVSEDPIEAFLQEWQTPFGGLGHWINFNNGADDDVMQVVDRGELSEPVTLEYANFFEELVLMDATEFTDYSCIGGGSVKLLTVPQRVNAHYLTNCASTSGTYSGEALRIVSHHRPFHAIGHYKNLKFVDAEQTVSTLSGRFRDGGNQSFVGDKFTPSWTNVEFTSTHNNEPFALTRFNLARYESSYTGFSTPADGFFDVSVSADFGVSADWSQQSQFDVKISLSTSLSGIAEPETFNWASGTIVITALDGSSINIEIDEANPAEFTILLEGGESLGSYKWADGYQIKLSRHWD